MRTSKVPFFKLLIFFMLLLGMQQTFARVINQAAFRPGTTTYEFGYNSVSNLHVVNAPFDADWNRWATLHDGQVYRLYVFRQGTNNILYQFGYNPALSAFQYGYLSDPVVQIANLPIDADSSRLMMLHDGIAYRLYLPRLNQPWVLYQFALNPLTRQYEYGYQSIPMISISGMPLDVDWNRTAVLHDGLDYRFVAMKSGTNHVLYHAGYNQPNQRFEYQYRSIPIVTLVGMPINTDTRNFSMLHDGKDYRVYFLTQY